METIPVNVSSLTLGRINQTKTSHSMIDILGSVLGIIFFLGFIALYFWSVFFTYRDAKSRGKPAIIIALLVAFVAWPLGFLIWMIARPRLL